MTRILNISTLVLLVMLSCKGQNSDPTAFIPVGYYEFKNYSGDLNKDDLKDLVLIIKKIDSTNIVVNEYGNKVDRNRRGIIVLFKTTEGYQLADQNLDCFSSENEYGGNYFAPELWIEIRDNNLYIHYGHGRYGYWEYGFRFQNSHFDLIGYDASYNRGPVILTETSINFLTNRKIFKKNTDQNAIEGEEVFKETWTDIEINRLIKLSEIKDFDELDIGQH